MRELKMPDTRRRNYELFLEYIKKIQSVRSLAQLDIIVTDLCNFLNLDGYTWFFLGSSGKIIEIDTRPTEWTRKYNEGLFIYSDPIAQTAATSNQPFIWDQALKVRKLSPKEWSIMKQGKDYGVSEGVHFPIHDANANVGSLSFYSDNLNHIFEVWSEYQTFLSHISFLCHTLTKGMPALSHKELFKNNHRLSRAEAEVLSLAAQGWRNGNIADYLFISESAVKKRAHSAFRKLGVRTMPQATVAAVLRREISPYGLANISSNME